MDRLKISICGGGVESLCLAYILSSKRTDWEVKLFTTGLATRNENAAIGLYTNGQAALSLLSSELKQALEDAGGTTLHPSVRLMMGTGPGSGNHIGDIDPPVPKISVRQGPFLRAIQRKIPENVIVTGKELTEIITESADGAITLRFGDGTLYQTDALIGCDGMDSIVRQTVLGPKDPAARPVYTGGYIHRIVVPLDVATSAFGDDYCSLQSEHGWVGDGGFMLTNLVDNGHAVEIVAGWSEGKHWPHSTPVVAWPKDRLRKDLANWGFVGRALTKIFTEQPELWAIAGRTHLGTSTFYRDRVCITGDAALVFPPFQGAAEGQAIEDALMLSTVLGVCSTRDHVRAAFRTYDALRRPRRTAVAESSEWAKRLFTGKDPEVGLDLQRFAETLPTWGSGILDYDLVAAQNEALERMRKAMSSLAGST